MSEFKHKLTLSVTDYGERSFTSEEDGHESQDSLTESIEFYFLQAMYSILNCPPSAYGLGGKAADISGENPLLAMIGHIHREYWSADHNFEDCLTVHIDGKKMCGGEGDEVDDEILKKLINAASRVPNIIVK